MTKIIVMLGMVVLLCAEGSIEVFKKDGEPLEKLEQKQLIKMVTILSLGQQVILDNNDNWIVFDKTKKRVYQNKKIKVATP